MKQCIKCMEYKEISDFVKRGDGTRNICKTCYNLSKRKTPLPKICKENHKHCARCNKEKPLFEFNMRLISGKYRYFSYCKECEKKINNTRYAHKCIQCGKEYKSGRKDSQLCESCKNLKFSNAGRERFIQRNRIPENNPWYGKPRIGSDNPNYNPDKTEEEREAGRIIPGYKDWIQNVYQRDHYTCQCCGNNHGGNLNAHHLDGYNWCKERRTDPANGVTLCDECHTKFHKKYGFRNNTKEQYIEFLLSSTKKY